MPHAGIDDRPVVLVDDVLLSAPSVRAALVALRDLGRPRSVQLTVLVDRGTGELRIRADFVGKNVPTSGSRQVRVHLIETDGTDKVLVTDGGPGRRRGVTVKRAPRRCASSGPRTAGETDGAQGTSERMWGGHQVEGATGARRLIPARWGPTGEETAAGRGVRAVGHRLPGCRSPTAAVPAGRG
jgi:hypothetical protein